MSCPVCSTQHGRDRNAATLWLLCAHGRTAWSQLCKTRNSLIVFRVRSKLSPTHNNLVCVMQCCDSAVPA